MVYFSRNVLLPFFIHSTCGSTSSSSSSSEDEFQPSTADSFKKLLSGASELKETFLGPDANAVDNIIKLADSAPVKNLVKLASNKNLLEFASKFAQGDDDSSKTSKLGNASKPKKTAGGNALGVRQVSINSQRDVPRLGGLNNAKFLRSVSQAIGDVAKNPDQASVKRAVTGITKALPEEVKESARKKMAETTAAAMTMGVLGSVASAMTGFNPVAIGVAAKNYKRVNEFYKEHINPSVDRRVGQEYKRRLQGKVFFFLLFFQKFQ